jgi:hypothetical protein
MNNSGDRRGKQAMKVKKVLQQLGGTAKDAAEDQLAQVGEMVSEYYWQGRDNVHGVVCACEQFIRDLA